LVRARAEDGGFSEQQRLLVHPVPVGNLESPTGELNALPELMVLGVGPIQQMPVADADID